MGRGAARPCKAVVCGVPAGLMAFQLHGNNLKHFPWAEEKFGFPAVA